MGRHRAAALTAVLIAAFVAFPSVGVGQDTSGDDVPMFRGNPGRSGVQPGPGPEANVDQLWRFQTGAAIRSSPVVVGGAVYLGSMDGNVYAVDAATGTELWRFSTSDRVVSSPAIADGTVYVGSDDGVLYAIGGPGSSIDATATAGPASTVAPPGTTPIAPLTDGQIRPGITVEVNDDDVVLRDAPSLDSEIVATLRRGTELIVIGPSEEGDGHIWWPVAEPSTGRVGYVRETFLTVKD
ncbi:MAG: eukaryotic-like serine/threonine-protein kinase [Thermomicrobiales bacterium]|jgi:hypothetical protein|nr:eukaryotic-like serine/threonine-protein kinase [Thermomicrobiales bacterium]